MRLSSLARKIRITPKKLSSFLEENDIPLEKGVNTKLDDDAINLVLEHFKVTLEEPKREETEESIVTEIEETTIKPDDAMSVIEKDPEETLSPTIENTESEEEVVAIAQEELSDKVQIDLEDQTLSSEEESIEEEVQFQQEEVQEENKEEELQQEVIPNIADTPQEEATEEKIEEISKEYEPIETPDGVLIEARAELAALDDSIDIIKAPKPQPLQGLTIKGKIELPDPKAPKPKKEIPEKPLDPNEIIYTSGPTRERRKKVNNQKNKSRHKPKEVNTVELERKRKARKAQKEKERKEQLEKEAKAQYYKKKIKAPVKPKAVKKKPKKKVKVAKEPKFEGNALQRFWHWLNT